MTQDKGKLVHSHPANELTEKLFGFESVIRIRYQVDATAASFGVVSDTVPTGKIWKITHVSTRNIDGDIATRTQINVVYDEIRAVIYDKTAVVAQRDSVHLSVELYLTADDYIEAFLFGVAVDETCELNIFGYEMNAP